MLPASKGTARALSSHTRVAAIAASLCLSAPAAAQELYVTGGRVVDVEAREIRAQNLWIQDGIIRGTPPEPPEGFEGEIVDVEGRFIIPGLVDLHTHSFGNQAPGEGAMEFLGTPGTANRMLYAGVTAFLDLFGLEDQLFGVREAQRANDGPGADIFVSGSCLTAPEGHCTEYGIPTRTMSTPEEAREQVRALAARRPDVVKIVYAPTGRMPSIDRATLAAAVEAATGAGISTVVHVNTWEDARDAAEAGATAVTHVPPGALPDDVLATLVARGTVSIPTLAVELGLLSLTARPELLEHPLARAVSSEGLRSVYASGEVGSADGWRARQVEQKEEKLAAVRRMHEAGVPILAGTDSGNYGTIQGWSVHHELMLLVEAGLGPWEALAAATTRAADFLRRDYGVGVGAQANLVVLEASPIEDIANTQRIAFVIHRGRLVDREALLAR